MNYAFLLGNEEKDIKEISKIMENCIENLKVPFKVDVAIGRSWGESK
jgi:DNA polymerase I-like protein with 3'-5' exonuclease and polymerase domains